MSRSVASHGADAVVVGAGLAGAVSAALLAHAGHRVHVLERDAHAGGCAASFDDAGYRFAVGATVGMGLERGGLVRSVLDLIGAAPRVRIVDPAIRVVVDDRELLLHADRRRWRSALGAAFPEAGAALERAWDEIERMADGLRRAAGRFPVLPLRHPYDLLDSARAAHPSLAPVVRRLRSTLGERLDHHGLRDRHARAFIDGQLLDALQCGAADAVAPNAALALDVYRHGAQYVDGGLASLAEACLDVVRRNGGAVRFATAARAIEVDDRGGVVGVHTRHGLLRAPVVISSVPLRNTVALLGDAAPGPLRARDAAQGAMWGAFTLYAGVAAAALREAPRPYQQLTELDVLRVHRGDEGERPANLLVSVSPAGDERRAPPGHHAVTVSTHVDAEAWLRLAERPADYEAAKRALETRLLEQVERLLPGFGDGITYLRSGTPRTFLRYTRRAGGTVGGFPQTVRHANFAAPSHRSGIAGLYLAGDTIFPGQGTLAVTSSGVIAARSAARRLRPTFTLARGRLRSVETQEVAA